METFYTMVILSADYMKKLFDYKIMKNSVNYNTSFSFSHERFEIIKEKFLGKTILFTNRDNWSNEEIVAAYRSQFHVEEAFKQMKNTKYISFRPVRHFTDKTIIVHAFYSVLGYSLSCLLQREMEELGYKMSINKILDGLNQVMLTINISYNSSSNGLLTSHGITEASDAIEAYINKHELRKYICR
jgi:transposase